MNVLPTKPQEMEVRDAEQDLTLLSSSPIVQGLNPNTHGTFSTKLLFAQAKAPSL